MRKSVFGVNIVALSFLVVGYAGLQPGINHVQAQPAAAKASSCVQRMPSHRPGSVMNPIKINPGEIVSGTLPESQYTSEMIYYLEVIPDSEYLIQVEGINAVYGEDAIAHMKYIGVDVSQQQTGEPFLARGKIGEGETGKDMIVRSVTECLFIRLWGWAHANDVDYKFKIAEPTKSLKEADPVLVNTFSNAEHGYSISFPEDWVYEISGNTVLISGKDGTEEYFTTVNLQALPSTRAGGAHADLADVFLFLKSQFESAGGKVSGAETFEHKSRGISYPGLKLAASYPMHGQHFRQETFVLRRDDAFFLQISYTAPENLFDRHRETGMRILASLEITPEDGGISADLKKKDSEILRVLQEHYLESNIIITGERLDADTVWYYFSIGGEMTPEAVEALKPELQGAAETAERWAETVAVLYGYSQNVRIILHAGDTVILHAEFLLSDKKVSVVYGQSFTSLSIEEALPAFNLVEIFQPCNAAKILESRLTNSLELEQVNVAYCEKEHKTLVAFEHPSGMNIPQLMILYLAILNAAETYLPYSEHVGLVMLLGGQPFLRMEAGAEDLRSFRNGLITRRQFFTGLLVKAGGMFAHRNLGR